MKLLVFRNRFICPVSIYFKGTLWEYGGIYIAHTYMVDIPISVCVSDCNYIFLYFGGLRYPMSTNS